MKSPLKLENSVDRATKMLRQMINPKYVGADKAIPVTLLKHCEGIAFITIFKAGFMVVGGNLGGGCVIAKVKDPSDPRGWRWSGPTAVQSGGLGGGFTFGAERIDSIVILNTNSAVNAMKGDGQISFGGNISLAAGPVGRDIEGHVGLSNTKEIVAAYSYSQAKGAYIGGTLEGSFLVSKNEYNKQFYGDPSVTPDRILSGEVPTPPKAAALIQELYDIIDHKGSYVGLEAQPSIADMQTSGSARGGPISQPNPNLASSGRNLLTRGLSGGDADGLPPDWRAAKAENGDTYYYNVNTNETRWDKPVAPPKPKASPPPPALASRPPVPQRPPAPRMPRAVAIYDYTAAQSDELSFRAGDEIEIIEKTEPHWWKGRVHGRTGMIPTNYIEEK